MVGGRGKSLTRLDGAGLEAQPATSRSARLANPRPAIARDAASEAIVSQSDPLLPYLNPRYKPAQARLD